VIDLVLQRAAFFAFGHPFGATLNETTRLIITSSSLQ
jgi:hypothetical protein